MGSYKDSAAYQRSERQRPDAAPVWPLTFLQPPCGVLAQQQAERELMRVAAVAGQVC